MICTGDPGLCETTGLLQLLGTPSFWERNLMRWRKGAGEGVAAGARFVTSPWAIETATDPDCLGGVCASNAMAWERCSSPAVAGLPTGITLTILLQQMT